MYDGGHDYTNCSDVNEQTFSYNAAILTQGAAFLYNFVSMGFPRIKQSAHKSRPSRKHGRTASITS